MLSRPCITFLPRSKRLLISWLQSPSALILEPQKIKSATVSTVSLSISHEVTGPDFNLSVFLFPFIASKEHNLRHFGVKKTGIVLDISTSFAKKGKKMHKDGFLNGLIVFYLENLACIKLLLLYYLKIE